jgi:hypothetical protein
MIEARALLHPDKANGVSVSVQYASPCNVETEQVLIYLHALCFDIGVLILNGSLILHVSLSVLPSDLAETLNCPCA